MIDPTTGLLAAGSTQPHARRLAVAWTLALLGVVSPASGPGGASAREPETDPARVVMTGVHDPRLECFDRLMRGFLAANRVPGAALAVTRDGRLVYARGFGFADLEKAEPVRPHALFRIASVSKPLTAVTVLHLIDQGKLRLNSKILNLIGPEPGGGDGLPADPRWVRITVGEVLQHRGGWDPALSFDPMFRSVVIAREFHAEPPAGPALVVRSMLRRPLDFDPGSRFAYSNFGYCVLGRVIEKVTGEPYGEAVQSRVLRPLGIDPRAIRLGRTLPAGRAPGEVHYYDEKGRTGPAVVGRPIGRTVPEPYGAWSLEAMDAHGGWVASAPALVKFASAFDHPARCKVLTAWAVAAMFARPPGPAGFEPDGTPKDAYHGCGWSVRPVGRDAANTWHNGALAGTASILVRRSDGLNWAVLFNTRDDSDGHVLAAKVDPLVHQAAELVRVWPDKNLFHEAPAGAD